MKALGLIRELERREASAHLPSISALRNQLSPSVIIAVTAYLRNAEIVSDAMGAVRDPWDPSFVMNGGAGLQSDGEWVWRQDLWHYVSAYRISLPAEFVNGVVNGHQPKPLSVAQIHEAMRVNNDTISGRSHLFS